MAKKYEINAEKMEELQSARKKNRDKNIDRRLQALILYGEGQTGKDISAATGYSRQYLYVGRLNRSYKDKTSVIVYDYVDSHISIFDKQYSSRLTAYKKLGYKIISELYREKQAVNSIYDKGNYAEVFERDLVEANSEIVISSPGLLLRKVQRMISILKPRQEAGVSITVITSDPDISLFYNSDELCEIIELMRHSGINVLLSREENEHYAVIDKKLVWHGGMNLLGKEDVWDNLIRVENASVAAELMELSHRSGIL